MVHFLKEPIYIKIRLSTILILLVILGLVITGTALYNNYVFHNLFFQNLSTENVDSIYVYDYYKRGSTVLSEQETEAVICLLRNIRIKEEPYKNYGLMGDKGVDYHIKLKCGIQFDLDLGGGDPGVYILNDNAYSIGYREDPEAAEDFENIWKFQELHAAHIQKYYPDSK